MKEKDIEKTHEKLKSEFEGLSLCKIVKNVLESKI